MAFARLHNKVEQVARRANFLECEGLDREEADDDGNHKSVKVICQERRFDATNEGVQNHTNGKEKGCGDNVHSGPVKKSVSSGSRIVILSAYSALMAAEAPSSILAMAMMLLIRHRTIQTMWPALP